MAPATAIQTWVKRGLLIEPPTELPWVAGHAAVPLVDRTPEGELHVYFAPRDERGRSHIARARLEALEPGAELRFDPEPVLGPGPLGAFDDSGAMTGCLVRTNEELRLYYIGWSLGVTVPFYTFVGLAVSRDGGESFERVSPAPVLGRGPTDPFFAAGPHVLVEDGLWRMWYASCREWTVAQDGKPKHHYRIGYAESDDGIEWRRDGRICIDLGPGEYAMTTPRVIRDGDRYRMWYSYRGEAYRIGYAESADGIEWERHDDAVSLAPSESGWDSEMIEYPWLVSDGGALHMLYNGNGFGETGVGLATLER